jgi:uncharacterized short protein YbdD (DUF466 family)
LRSKFKVSNNGTRHIIWRWSTYMPNMKSLSWTTKRLQPGHDLLATQGPIWLWAHNTRSKVTKMVGDTSSGGGLPTCQIWKAYLERQKSYNPDTICYGRSDRFHLEVKIQGQRSPTMVRNTLSVGGLPTCQIWKAYLERQKSYSPDTICYGRRDRFDFEVKFKVKGHQQRYATHRLEVVYLHAKYAKPVLNEKKVTARTRFVTDGRTDWSL